MKDTNYIVVQHWMVSKLELSGNELLVFALIHGFSQDNESSFIGSAQYIADSIGTSRRSVMDILSRLVEKNLLSKSDSVVNGVKLCSYKSCSNLIGYEESSQGGMKNLHREGYEESSHNILDNTSHIQEHKKVKGSPVFSIPEGLDDDYKNALMQYIQHRKEMKKPMTDLSLQKFIAELEPYSVQERISAINVSIANGWRGVFPKPKNGVSGVQGKREGYKVDVDQYRSL